VISGKHQASCVWIAVTWRDASSGITVGIQFHSSFVTLGKTFSATNKKGDVHQVLDLVIKMVHLELEALPAHPLEFSQIHSAAKDIMLALHPGWS
jgi:hypothetical protein